MLKAAFLDAFSGCHCCVRCYGHHAMERPLPQSWSSPSPSPTIAHYNGTLQWHHVHSPKVGRHPPPNHSTLQSHPAMAPSNGTTSTPSKLSTPPKLVVTLPPNHSTLQWHPTMAPSNGTTSTPPTKAHYNQPRMAPAWCHVQSAKVVRRPPPFLEVRTPIAMAIWGIILLGLGRSSYRGKYIISSYKGGNVPSTKLT